MSIEESVKKRPYGNKPNKFKKREPRPDDICCECRGKEHWKTSPECPKCKQDSHGGNSAKISVDGLKSLGEQEVEKVLIAAEGKLKNDSLILDCGAMAHMFSDKRYFTILEPKAAGHFVTIGGHNQVPVKGRGSIHFYAQLNNAYHNINLNNILYIPELGVNLVSLSALQRNGSSIKSSKKRTNSIVNESRIISCFYRW